MITLSDCEAFCDADSGWVGELARRECLGMVQAYAKANALMTGRPAPVLPNSPPHSMEADSNYRRAA